MFIEAYLKNIQGQRYTVRYRNLHLRSKKGSGMEIWMPGEWIRALHTLVTANRAGNAHNEG